MSTFCAWFASPLGMLRLEAGTAGLERITLCASRDAAQLGEASGEAHALLEPFCRALAAYFAGEATTFSLPLALTGTPFQRRVWERLQTIPYGETWSYGELAARLGNPRAARAVAAACAANPIPIFVPCHRVVAADGSLHGFTWGLDAKRRLLELEKAEKG